MEKLSKTTRESHIKALLASGVSFGVACRAGSLSAHAKDLAITAPLAVAELMSPHGSSPWDPLSPRLNACGITEFEMSKRLQRAIVKECMFQLLVKGDTATIVPLCTKLCSAYNVEKLKDTPVLAQAVAEVLEIAKGLLTLLASGKSEDLHSLLAARSGVKLIAKQALT